MPTTATFELQQQGLYPVLKESDRPAAQLFLGTQKAAQNRSLLRCHRVTRIVCVGTPAFHQDVEKASAAVGREGGGGGVGRRVDDGLVYLEIPILDLPSENLLARLDDCVSFIGNSMRHGRTVLVNCVYAQSRSPAVVVAYLMKRQGLSLAQARSKVRDAQPTVHINPGFEAQLTLYEDMGCGLLGTRGEGTARTDLLEEPHDTMRTSKTSKAGAGATYRWFLFASDLNTCGGEGRRLRHAACDGAVSLDNREGDAAPHHARAVGTANRTVTVATYRCKACRTPLFSESNVIDHLHPIVLATSDSTYASFRRHGDGSSWLAAREAAAAAAATFSTPDKPSASVTREAKGRWSQRQAHVRSRGAKSSAVSGLASAGSTGRCTSVFTEILDWVGMAGCTRGFSRRDGAGKISCPGRKGKGKGVGAVCGSKLGAWSLEGTACSCGRMVKPAMQFTLSRIERVRAA